ncbi:hypothetical protein ONZ51_g1431 [Trametes cubensis]|uniref:F-box domain-containing protein n=1 Tax=Trametes cubensis TaxID=1111947 RepID=A0AAD7U247_9APHY|nr:hypothetical protein ONZ51_g1431 [Trametes cubensis]
MRNDRLALCNCTLACRTWLLVARPYLFRCLSFDTSLRRVPAIQRIRNNPDIAPLVRVLELKHGADFNALDLPVATAAFSRDPPQRSEFSKVTTLRLTREFAFTKYTASLLSILFPLVDTLNLERCVARSLESFTTILCAFPNLRTVDLNDVEWLHLPTGDIEPEEDIPFSMLPEPRLASSHIDSLSVGFDALCPTIAQWFASSTAYRSPRVLKGPLGLNANALRTLVQVCGEHAEHLHLSIADAYHPERALLEAAQLDLSSCLSLRSLCLNFEPFPRSRSRSRPPPRRRPTGRNPSRVFALLSTIRSRHLEEVRFLITSQTLREMEWDELDRKLSSEEYLGAVRRVALEVYSALVDDFDFVRERLPLFSMRGVLEFSAM